MTTVETVGRIRRAYFVQHQSVREIARRLHVSRKAIESEDGKFRYERTSQPKPKLGEHIAELERLLAQNESKPRRERLTLVRLFEALQDQGYEGGYDTVRRHARRWQREETGRTATAFVPLSFDPGDAFQFDWSHEIVVLGGVATTVKVAHVRLCHSRMFFVRAYPRESQEMVFDAHARAFAYFGGVCTRGIYDNMTTAVDAVFVGKERKFNRRFLQLCNHYLVEPVACTPAAGWEKGQVENQVGFVRERFFRPRLRFASYEELNAWLEERCREYARTHRHPELRDRTVAEVFEDERAALMCLPGAPFDGFHAVTASVSKTLLVRFDHNKYSVAARALGRPVEVHAYADRIVIRQGDDIVAEHPRRFGREQTVYDPWHYVLVLAKKPGALRNGAPFKQLALPPALERLRSRLKGSNDGDRQMVKILTAATIDGLDALEVAASGALAQGVTSADVVLNILARSRSAPMEPTIEAPVHLKLSIEPEADPGRYDALRSPKRAA